MMCAVQYLMQSNAQYYWDSVLPGHCRLRTIRLATVSNGNNGS